MKVKIRFIANKTTKTYMIGSKTMGNWELDHDSKKLMIETETLTREFEFNKLGTSAT